MAVLRPVAGPCKNTVDNLAAIKKQQWIVTCSAVALFAEIGAIAHTMKQSPSQHGMCILIGLIVVGVLVSWYFLIRMQCDAAKVRCALQRFTRNYYSLKERKLFGMDYGNILFRHWEYLLTFVVISGIAGVLVIGLCFHFQTANSILPRKRTGSGG
jgi:hypothetical protein